VLRCNQVKNLLHPFQPFILGQKNLAPRMALLQKIPLVPHTRHVPRRM
jgi:hypothetical protein